MKLTLVLPLMAGLVGCSSNNTGDPGDGGTPDGGPPPAPGTTVLDSSSMDPNLYLSMAIGPNDRVGVAYFKGTGGVNFEIRYVEWQNGIVSASQKLPPSGGPPGKELNGGLGLGRASRGMGSPG